MFANMLDVFSMLSGIDVSYKTVERLYSDEEVIMALHNLHTLLLKKKGVEKSDATGDGTGYSLTISKHYESVARELKEKAKGDSEASTSQVNSEEDAKKREDRINCAQLCTGVWHNLFNLAAPMT